MNVFDKLLTAIKGGARELGEAVVDSQSVRIFEQEIEDAKASLVEAKDGLTEIIARKMANERQLQSVLAQISEHEGYALQAIEKSQDSLALEISQTIANLEQKAEMLKIDIESYHHNVETLKAQIKLAEKVIAQHERDLSVVRTQESVFEATSSVTQTVSANDSAIGAASESLDRIKAKQQFEQDKLAASVALKKEMDGEELAEKLKDAGIKTDGHTAEAVLARLKARTN